MTNAKWHIIKKEREREREAAWHNAKVLLLESAIPESHMDGPHCLRGLRHVAYALGVFTSSSANERCKGGKTITR